MTQPPQDDKPDKALTAEPTDDLVTTRHSISIDGD